ncbi:MAG: peptide chain release factor N(5)-glutamine methyltransferase [Patescibacteria group bacterium]
MTLSIKQALLSVHKTLKNGSASPILDGEVLLSSVLNKPREYLLTYPEKKLTTTQEKKFRQLVARRAHGEPIAYLTVHKEFYGLDFIVNKNVLIPRPETELLVEETIKRIRNYELGIRERIVLIDVGTGSGCIPIAIAKNTPNKNLKVLATDISAAALKVARQNAKKNSVKIKFYRGNLLSPLIHNSSFLIPASSYIITANLPYLTKKQICEKSIQCEPRSALYGGRNGLEYYEKLFKQISQLGAQVFGCSSVQVLLEIDPSQTSKIKKLIKKYLPTAKTEIKKDLAGHNRVVCASLTFSVEPAKMTH